MKTGPDTTFEIIRPPRFESEAQQALIDAGEADLQAGFKRAGRDIHPASSSDAGDFYDDTHLPAKLSEPTGIIAVADPSEPAAPAEDNKPVSGVPSLGDTWMDPMRRKLERAILRAVPYTAAGQVTVPRRPYNQKVTFIGAGNILYELSYDPAFPVGSTVFLPGDRNVCFNIPAGTEVWMRSAVVVGALSVIVEPLVGDC